VETAKAIVPVESPSTGKLAEILAREGVTVQMTQPLGTVQPG
jgi:pyruvate/2-oxoglutarate dehydrogenase complex dihydrolipoamide acyltransferase (E2) component